MFYVGQKVICINDNDLGARGSIKKGKVYVVKALHGKFGSADYILVENGGGWDDGGWFPSRFIPLEEKKTDISIFTKMLDGKKVPERT